MGFDWFLWVKVVIFAKILHSFGRTEEGFGGVVWIWIRWIIRIGYFVGLLWLESLTVVFCLPKFDFVLFEEACGDVVSMFVNYLLVCGDVGEQILLIWFQHLA